MGTKRNQPKRRLVLKKVSKRRLGKLGCLFKVYLLGTGIWPEKGGVLDAKGRANPISGSWRMFARGKVQMVGQKKFEEGGGNLMGKVVFPELR